MPYLKPESTLDTFDVSCKVSDGYVLVCCIKSIPDEVQMAITDEGEVV